MKTFKLFSMAALALLMAACSSYDNEILQPEQLQGKIHFTATIAAPNGGATTRTIYNETSDGYINVSWRAKEDGVYDGDKIALIHNGKKDVVTVTSVNPDGSAVIEGDIDATGTNGEDVVLVYPAATVNEVTGGTGYTSKFSKMVLAQDGTLEYIQNNLDLREGTGKLVISGSASLQANVKMASKIAIWELSLQNSSSSALNAKEVMVSDGSSVIAKAKSTTAKSDYYICVEPGDASTTSLDINATVGSDLYFYTKGGGVTLEKSTVYQSTVTMAKLESEDYEFRMDMGDPGMPGGGGMGNISISDSYFSVSGSGESGMLYIDSSDPATVKTLYGNRTIRTVKLGYWDPYSTNRDYLYSSKGCFDGDATIMGLNDNSTTGFTINSTNNYWSERVQISKVTIYYTNP